MDIEQINASRCQEIQDTLNGIGAFPVIICGLTIDRHLVVFGMSGQRGNELKEMLRDYLHSLDHTEYEIG